MFRVLFGTPAITSKYRLNRNVYQPAMEGDAMRSPVPTIVGPEDIKGPGHADLNPSSSS